MAKLGHIEKELKINPSDVKDKLNEYVVGKIEKAGMEGVVFGLSGGLDSTTLAYLLADVSEKKVLALSMPEEGVTDPLDAKDAEDIAKELDLDFRSIEVSSILEEFQKGLGIIDKESKLPKANLKSRTRMAILYYHSNLNDLLVAGCSNRSEIRSGYFTKFGDGACDFAPLGCLYKTQVIELANYMKVPERIIQKVPSAGLWRGQTDESELGISYEKLDRIYAGFDLGFRESDIAKVVGVKVRDVRKFKRREKRMKHKLAGAKFPSFDF